MPRRPDRLAGALLSLLLAAHSPASAASGLVRIADVPVPPSGTSAAIPPAIAAPSESGPLDLTLPPALPNPEAAAAAAPAGPRAESPSPLPAALEVLAQAAAPPPSGIVRIHLGGTIAMEETGGIRSGARDSSQMILTDLEDLGRTVKTLLDRNLGPLITQGSDSLDTTGLVLSQLFPDRLIVLTAAFHPFSQPGSDGPENLRGAQLVAGFRGKTEVPQVPYAVMNGNVFLASSLAKLDTDFKGGRRGFQSFAGPVGRIQGDSVAWDPVFLKEFGRSRKKSPSPAAAEPISLAPVEAAYVNSHTPPAYIRAVLARLEEGQSAGAVFSGVFPESGELTAEIRRLRARGLPVLVQAFAGRGIKAALFPRGIQPFQLLYKLSVLAGKVRGLGRLGRALGENLAGEVLRRRPDPSQELEVVEGNFYRGKGVSRGFLLYHQNLPLMRSALKDEIRRLAGEAGKGRRAELILEGIGNGHVHLDLRDLLAEARRAGIAVTITTRVKDAVPDAAYEVGRALAAPEIGARPAPSPGRAYLRAPAR